MDEKHTAMAERIKAMRAATGLTQQQFADKLGVKRNTVCFYETGRTIPLNGTRELMAREFGFNREWIDTGEGNMYDDRDADARYVDEIMGHFHLIAEMRPFVEMVLHMSQSQQESLAGMLQSLLRNYAREHSQIEPVSREDIHAELDRQLSEEETAEAAS